MIKQAFRLIWNRRRTNALVFTELLVSFLVLCGVLTAACQLIDGWRVPLGFRYQGIWELRADSDESYFQADEERRAELRETSMQLLSRLRSMDEIATVSPGGHNVPFGRGFMGNSTNLNGVQTGVEMNQVTPEMMEILELRLIAGRWLEPGDAMLNWEPNVITHNLAVAMFGDEDPIGKRLQWMDENGEVEELDEEEKEPRIIGVIADIRRRGEFSPTSHATFYPGFESEDDPPSRSHLLLLRDGVPTAFEEELVRAMHEVAPSYTFTVKPLAKGHAEHVRDNLLPVMIGGTVAGFLIIMVGMGLVGVLWQNVTRRTSELGLRRALGATAADVRRQVLLELLALTTVAVFVGSLLFIQIPILQISGSIGLHVFLFALALALLVIYPFVALCGLYPSWLATRVDPVRALQYE